jgi:hypothetical protein
VLDREAIVGALQRLAALLVERGVQGEICLLGGTVMVLAFRARPSTKDVDAIFHPAALVRELARTVAAERALPSDWLNDGAKAFISARHETTAADLPQFEGLRLTAPTAEYMLAMKCMASRIAAGPDDPGDVADISFLAFRLGLRSAAEALAIVARYYPEDRVPPRATYLLEDMFSRTEPRP